jgi:sirohydrochlorin cobaltochelatase
MVSAFSERKIEMKRSIAFIMGLTLAAASLTACGSNDSSSESSSSKETTSASEEASAEDITEEDTTGEAASEDEEDEEDYTTGDASLDNIRNQDEIGENELLVLSFGTSFNDSRRLTIGAIEDALEKAFPDYSVRRGFTANIIIDHVNSRDGFLIDDVDAALARAEANGVKNLVVQPTHLMNGLEYNDLVNAVGAHADAFEKVAFGEPLLTSEDDFKRVEEAIVDWTKEYDDGKTAICFMGHGTEADSNGVYQQMQDLLTADGYENYFVGTVEATPSLDDVLAKVKAGDYEKVVLEPLMVVAGDHAHNDMAGDEDSWKSAFLDAGYDVECLLRGLGENEAIRQLYIEHAQAAIDQLK